MNRNYKKENMVNAGDINRRVYDGKFGEFYDKVHRQREEDSLYAKYIKGSLSEAGLLGSRTIFEIGAGTGNMTVHLARLFPDSQIIVNDISEVQLRILQNKLRHPHLQTVHGPAEKTIEDLSRCDLLTCSGVLHHFEDPYKIMEKISGQCDGVFIACEPAYRHQISWKAMMLHKQARGQSWLSFIRYLMGYYKILRWVRNLIYRLLSALGLMKTINIGGGVELSIDEYLQQHASERHAGVDYERIASILHAKGFGYIKVFPAAADYTDESAYKLMVQNNLIHHWGLIAKRDF